MQAGNRVRIEVAGSWYVISTTEESSYVEELARELDEQLTKLLGKNDSLSINDALILCSLQFLLDKRQSERSADRLRQQFSGYMEEIKRAKDGKAEGKRRAAPGGIAASGGASAKAGRQAGGKVIKECSNELGEWCEIGNISPGGGKRFG